VYTHPFGCETYPGVPAEGEAEDAKIERQSRSIFVAAARGRLPPLKDFDFNLLILKRL
jgi:hypothetical protein